MTRILMVTSPGGNRGPANAFQNHLNALNDSTEFEIKEWHQLFSESELATFDVFWFSVRFHPNYYYELKKRFPEKIFWMGPNVLFEKAEVGPSDDWEKWFVSNVECDVYTNKADFYLNRARQFFDKSKKYSVLRNCLNLKNYSVTVDQLQSPRSNDVLVYYKNRRIDNQLDRLFPRFMENIKKLDVSFDVIEYGNYNREDYFDKLSNSKVCVWLSIEDFCSNAQLEAQYLNVPVIGTCYNNTDVYDTNLNVAAANMSDDKWITWNENMPELFSQRVENFLNKDYNTISMKPRNHILENYSYDAYAKQVKDILG